MTLTVVKTTALTGTITNAQLAGGIDLTSKVTGTLPIANGGTNSTATTFVNAASNVTGALPIVNGGTGGTSYAPGVTMMDAWYITSTQTHSSGEVLWNAWSRISGRSLATLGSAMTQSSGVFTFPTTGKYWVLFKTYCNGNAGTTYAGAQVVNNGNNGTDGASLIDASYINRDNGADHNALMCQVFIDVTDTTSNVCKIKFVSNQGATSTWAGGSAGMETKVFFVRIGDT